MLDDIETTEAVETEAVAEVVDTPAVEDTAPAEVAEVAPEPAPEAEAPAVEETPAFDWTAWDGAIDVLPKDIREHGTKIADFYAKKYGDYDKLKEDNDRLQSYYDALLDGGPDPRIAELEAERDRFRTKHDTLNQTYAQEKAAWEADADQQAADYAAWFKSTYSEFFEVGSEEASKLRELLEKDVDPEHAAEVLRLGPEAEKFFRKEVEGGLDSKTALRLTRYELQQEAPKPRPAADLVSGSKGSAQRPSRVERDIGDAKDQNELRAFAAERALKKHGLASQ